MAENKIPLLTEVYQPKAKPAAQGKQADPTLGITPELIERVTAHVRPRLVTEITDAVLETLRYELKKNMGTDLRPEMDRIQLIIEGNMRDFVDRTQADLKTDLPRMYQASAEFVHKELVEKLAALEHDTVTAFDAQMADRINAASQQVVSQVAGQVQSLQDDLGAQLTQQLNHEADRLKQAAQQDAQSQITEAVAELLASAKEDTSQAFAQQIEGQVASLQERLSEAARQAAESAEQQVTRYLEASIHGITQRLAEAEQQASSQMDTTEQTVAAHLAAMEQSVDQRVKQIEETAKQQLDQMLAASLSSHQNDLQQKLELQFLGIHKKAETDLAAQLEASRTQTVSGHVAELSDTLNNQFAEISQQAELDLMQTLDKAKNAALEQMRQNLTAATASLYTEAAGAVRDKFTEEMAGMTASARQEFMTQVNADLPAVQAVLLQNIERLLAERLPAMEHGLRSELTAEIRALLQQVRFVLP